MAKSRGDFRRWSEMVGEVPRCAATNHSTRISRLIDLIIATSFSSILRRLPLVVLCKCYVHIDAVCGFSFHASIRF